MNNHVTRFRKNNELYTLIWKQSHRQASRDQMDTATHSCNTYYFQSQKGSLKAFNITTQNHEQVDRRKNRKKTHKWLLVLNDVLSVFQLHEIETENEIEMETKMLLNVSDR